MTQPPRCLRCGRMEGHEDYCDRDQPGKRFQGMEREAMLDIIEGLLDKSVRLECDVMLLRRENDKLRERMLRAASRQ